MKNEERQDDFAVKGQKDISASLEPICLFGVPVIFWELTKSKTFLSGKHPLFCSIL